MIEMETNTAASFEQSNVTNVTIKEERGANNANDETKSDCQESSQMPFYLMRPIAMQEMKEVNGSTNLILYNDLQQAFNKYCCKKVKEPLNAFLQKFPGTISTATISVEDEESKESSTLNSLLNSRIIVKEIQPLTMQQYSSFRLYPGPLPREYDEMIQSLKSSVTEATSSKKTKKSKKADKATDGGGGGGGGEGDREKRKKKKDKKKKKKSNGKD